MVAYLHLQSTFGDPLRLVHLQSTFKDRHFKTQLHLQSAITVLAEFCRLQLHSAYRNPQSTPSFGVGTYSGRTVCTVRIYNTYLYATLSDQFYPYRIIDH